MIRPQLLGYTWNREIFGSYITTVWEWASYQIRNIAGCACAGNAGNVFPRRRLQRKPLFSDPGMHRGTCGTHVPWCMSGSLAPGGRENVTGIPGACAPAFFRIWQEAHGVTRIVLWFMVFWQGSTSGHLPSSNSESEIAWLFNRQWIHSTVQNQFIYPSVTYSIKPIRTTILGSAKYDRITAEKLN